MSEVRFGHGAIPAGDQGNAASFLYPDLSTIMLRIPAAFGT